MLREFVDGGNVRGGPGETDHVAPARVLAELLLDRGDHREGGEPLTRLGRARRPGPDLLQGARMSGAMLPDFQLGQMKAEGLGLPAQVLELAERLTASSRPVQFLLQQADVGT